MKNNIAIILLCLVIGCNQSQDKNFTVSESKTTAITAAIKSASPGVVSIYRNQEITQINRWTGRLKPIKPIQSSGSGFIISKDGYILTNAHNIVTEISNPSLSTTNIKIDVALPGGDHYVASIVGVDSRSDVALLKIEGEDFYHCELGDSDEAIVGEWVVALGNPKSLFAAANYQPIASAGIISAINADFGIDANTKRLMNNMIQTDSLQLTHQSLEFFSQKTKDRILISSLIRAIRALGRKFVDVGPDGQHVDGQQPLTWEGLYYYLCRSKHYLN